MNSNQFQGKQKKLLSIIRTIYLWSCGYWVMKATIRWSAFVPHYYSSKIEWMKQQIRKENQP